MSFLEADYQAVGLVVHERIVPLLARSPSADDRAVAVLLSRMVKADGMPLFDTRREAVQYELDQLELALQIDPLNINALLLAYGGCGGKTVHPLCAASLANRLVQSDPENGTYWLMLYSELERAGDESGALAALENIAEFPMSFQSAQLGWLAMETATRHWPEATQNQLLALGLNGLGLWMVISTPSYSEVSSACSPETMLEKGKTRQQLCQTIGVAMASSSSSFIDLMIGLGIEERALIALGEADNAEALEANAAGRARLEQAMSQNLYECDMADFAGLGSAPAGAGEFLRGLARYGELEYTHRRYQRHLDRWAPEVSSPGDMR